jgi:hypothetical protein
VNCERCSVSGKCDKCKPGYIVNVNKQCEVQLCGKYCAICVNDVCQQCTDRSVPVDGKCGDFRNA